MMQAVAILLIAVSAGANPGDMPTTAEQSVPDHAPVDTTWNDRAALADHQNQFDRAAHRETEPAAPAPMTDLHQLDLQDGFQPATKDHAHAANQNVRFAQHMEDHTWPTASASSRDNDRNDAVGDPRTPQFARPTYLDTHPAAKQADDPYVTFQSEHADAQQPTTRPNTAFAEPLQTPGFLETPNASLDVTLPPVATNSKKDTPVVTASATSDTSDAIGERGESTTRAAAPPATVDPNTPAKGGKTLLLLAFFASVGLNLYLGWITWDTYNRYHDMVSDIRYSNTSARRKHVDRERDLVDRRPVDSAA